MPPGRLARGRGGCSRRAGRSCRPPSLRPTAWPRLRVRLLARGGTGRLRCGRRRRAARSPPCQLRPLVARRMPGPGVAAPPAAPPAARPRGVEVTRPVVTSPASTRGIEGAQRAHVQPLEWSSSITDGSVARGRLGRELPDRRSAHTASSPPGRSVLTHSRALDPHSSFWIVYAPPEAARVCELHKVVVAAWELTAGSARATTPAAPARRRPSARSRAYAGQTSCAYPCPAGHRRSQPRAAAREAAAAQGRELAVER